MDLKYFNDQHEFLFNLFKEHYLLLNDRTQIRLDRYLYACMQHIRNKMNTESEMVKLDANGHLKSILSRLSYDLRADLTTFTIEYISIFNKQYTKALGLKMPADRSFQTWERITEYFDANIEKFANNLKDIILSVETLDEFNSLFPVELGKGKYHARLKTLCYMSLLTATNEFCNTILKYNNKKPMILNPNGATNLLKEEDGFYKLVTPEGEEEKYIWEYSDQAILGRIPPSQYGSHELLFPAI
jgi:hypothetical protein